MARPVDVIAISQMSGVGGSGVFTPASPQVVAWHACTCIHRGRFDYRLDTGALSVPAGHLVLFPPGCRRSRSWPSGIPFAYSHVRFAQPPWPELCFPARTRTGPLVFALDDRLEAAFTAMVETVQQLSLSADEAFRTRRIWNAIEAFLLDLNETEARRRCGADEEIAQLLVQLAAALSEPHSVAGLAARVGMSRSRFAERFRRETGTTPMAWIERRRLERAAELLRHSDQPVARIAAAVGFGDPAYFARRCRVVLGVAPSSLRRG